MNSASPVSSVFTTSPLQIFRNQGFIYSVILQDNSGNALPVNEPGYNFAFIIAGPPAAPSVPVTGAYGTTYLQNTSPVFGASGSGSLSFVFDPSDTATLPLNANCTFYVLGQPPSSNPSVYQAGQVSIVDSPPMPS
jgi:hypothetical protein